MSRYTDPEHHRSALITIDVQCDTLDGERFEVPGTSAILPRIGRLAATFRFRGAPIVHSVRLYKPDGSNVDLCRRDRVQRGASLVIAGSSGSQIAPPLLPSPPPQLDADLLLRGDIQEAGFKEWIIYKPRWGAFFKTPLESHLRGLVVSTLVFAGCNFPSCPRTSIYESDCSPGKAGGIQVSRSKRLDGTATRPLEPPYGGPTISRASADPACDPRSVASGCSAG